MTASSMLGPGLRAYCVGTPTPWRSSMTRVSAPSSEMRLNSTGSTGPSCCHSPDIGRLPGSQSSEPQPRMAITHSGTGSSALAFSPDGRWLAAAQDGVEVRRVADGTLMGTISNAFGGVMSLAFSPDSLQLASGDDNGVVCVHNIWDASLAWDLAVGGDVTGVAYGPGGTLASWSSNEEAVELWQADTGLFSQSYTGYQWSTPSGRWTGPYALMSVVRFGSGDAKPVAFQHSNPRSIMCGITRVWGRRYHGVAMIVLENDLQTNSELMQIVDTLNALCCRLGTGKRWQKQRRKD